MTVVGFFILTSFALPQTVLADELDVEKLQSQIYSAVNKVIPAVVAINDRGSIFSGVIVSKEGHILTAGHALRPNTNYKVILSDGRTFQSRGLGSNRRIDMAMLKISGDNLPFAEMGNSFKIIKNQPCIGVSHPGIFNQNRGAVVRFGYVIEPVTSNEGMIKSTAKMEPGDSGGPLIDLNGKVIGIHSNIRRDEEANYDVPVDSFRKHWDELNKAEVFYVDGYPSLPKLGFRGRGSRKGVEVLKVYEDGLAEKNGIKKSDLITGVGGTGVTSARQVYNRLIELRSEGTSDFFVNVTRGSEKPMSIRFKLSDGDGPLPKAFTELKDWPKQFSKLESKLDDNVFVVRSKFDGERISAHGTLIKATKKGNLISKSSRVGENPQVKTASGVWAPATVISRDKKNDLVLLNAKLPGAGLDLSKVLGDVEEMRGRLLLTPSPKDGGEVSIWGSRYFNVRRTQMSGGYLGVQLNQRNNQVSFAQVFSGAARKAGIKRGDILVRLDQLEVKRTTDAIKYLQTQDPMSTITAVIIRDEKEIKKEIVLGNRVDQNGHVADRLIGGKSLRRDGFQLAISHDGNVNPEECGSPVFDLNGEFVGINIARTSRVRCYVIPKTILKQFVESAGNTTN